MLFERLYAENQQTNITYLKHSCTGPEFLRLMAVYTHNLHKSFEETILNGHCQIFLEHANMAALSYVVCTKQPLNCQICVAWRKHHQARSRMREEEETKSAKLNQILIAEESQGMHRLLLQQKSKNWHLVRTMVTSYPNMVAHAARICIEEEIDPSALGLPDSILKNISDSTVQNGLWDRLQAYYREKGLGLWPSVVHAFWCQNAERELYKQFEGDEPQI